MEAVGMSVCPDCRYTFISPPDFPDAPICPACLYRETETFHSWQSRLKRRVIYTVLAVAAAGTAVLVGIGLGTLCQLWCP